MLTRAEMETIGSASVSLNTVRRKAGAPMTASELGTKGREKIAEATEHKSVASAAAASG